jgi:hypothetical protein
VAAVKLLVDNSRLASELQRREETVTVLKQDARPVQGAIADAVLLAVAFPAVVMVILDRRLEKRDLFGGASPHTQELSVTDRRVVDVLRRRHGISVVVRRQDPFGWS